MGGYSGEHAISIASGNQVYGQLDHTKYNVYKIVIDREGWYWERDGEHLPVDRGDFTVTDNGRKVCFDLAFIIVHGNPGENGVLQGYFDMLGIRYTTCGFYTSALTFQKGYCNPVVKSFGLVKVAKSVLLYKEPPTEAKLDELMEGMHYPVFVKPAAGGSSVATTKVKGREQLLPAIREAFTEDRQVLVEEFIKGRELSCGVLDGKALPVIEIIPKEGFYDYKNKYQAGAALEVTPAPISPSATEKVQRLAERVFSALKLSVYARMDFLLTEDEDAYCLEANTLPGMTPTSLLPQEAAVIGIDYITLCEKIIALSLEKYR